MQKRPEVIQLAIQGKLELLDRALETPAFFADANCKNADATLFFAESNSKIARAKAICAECPIKIMCLNWAVRNAEEGIYGATTPCERKKLRKGAEIVDISTIRIMQEQRDLILTSSLDQAVSHFNVNVRTIHRWRQMLTTKQKAS